jgi:hypothetical protein
MRRRRRRDANSDVCGGGGGGGTSARDANDLEMGAFYSRSRPVLTSNVDNDGTQRSRLRGAVGGGEGVGGGRNRERGFLTSGSVTGIRNACYHEVEEEGGEEEETDSVQFFQGTRPLEARRLRQQASLQRRHERDNASVKTSLMEF